MRGNDQQQNHTFSYISPKQCVRRDQPLRPIHTLVDGILTLTSESILLDRNTVRPMPVHLNWDGHREAAAFPALNGRFSIIMVSPQRS
jgi:hypothetical protein